MSEMRGAYLDFSDKRGEDGLRVRGERIAFRVASSMTQTPGTMSVKAYGLNEREKGWIEKKAHTVRLSAGEYGREGLLGVGQVVSASERLTNEGRVMELTAVDGDDFYAMPVNRSISGNISLLELVREMVALCGQSAGIGHISPMAGQILLPRGMAVVGTVIPVMRSVAKQLNAAFYVNQGLVYIVRPEERIGPQVTLYAEDMLSDAVRDGYWMKISHRMAPHIRVGGSVVMPDARGEASYRVQKIMAEGDTRGAVWKMEIEAAAQTVAGLAQSAVTDNVWR